MDNGFDLEKALRILKTKKITKETVAKITGVTPGYISKMLSGDKPITQSFIDVFLKEYSAHLEGAELIEFSYKNVLIAQTALQAKVELLTKINLALIKALGEISSNHSVKGIKELLKKDTGSLLEEFDGIVEDDAAVLLKSQQQV
jgi:transcriptional regulator with XRE-family HTH domain